MGKRFRGPVKRAQDLDIPSNEDDNQDEDGKSVKTEKKINHGSDKFYDEEEED